MEGGGGGGIIGLLPNLALVVLRLIYKHFYGSPTKPECPPIRFFFVNPTKLNIWYVTEFVH